MANGRNNGSKLDKRAAKDAQSLQRLHEIWNEAWRLVAEERFLHWEVAFPGVWTDWESAEHKGGFDAVVSNPPWDRIKFQEVEWFAARKLEIALATTAARRAELVAKLKRSNDLLAGEYDRAVARADTMSRMARDSGAFPLLSGGDTNIYSLFVELALSLIRPDGMVGVLTPSGIASDKTASTFFSQIATGKRLAALFDFENRRPPKQPFFPDVDSRFKFCTFIAAGARRSWPQANCGFFLRNTADTADPNRSFTLKAEDFALVNPNTGTAPIFRTRRDAEITTAIYRRFPVLVDRSVDPPRAVWPVKYATMFHMTNDSHLFRSRQDLEQMGAYPVEGNRWKKGDELFVPLYEGKMVQAYDHRAANIVINPRNVKRPAQPESTSRVCT